MRISEFAKKYNVNKTMIRHYTDILLLIPKKTKNGYFDYTKQCCIDMDDIEKYKKMGFTLKKICEIKKTERYVIKNTNEHVHYFNNVLLEHKKQLLLEIESINAKIKLIDQSRIASVESTKKGICINSIMNLECPICHRKYNLRNAIIKNNMLFKADFECKCKNSKYSIIEGIITYTKEIPQQASFTHDKCNITDLQIKQIKQIGDDLQLNLDNINHEKGIIFLDADADLLMMNVEDSFQSKGIYYFCSRNIGALLELKEKLEIKKHLCEFCFIHYETDLPLNGDFPFMIINGGNLCDLVLNKKSNTYLDNIYNLIKKNNLLFLVFIEGKGNTTQYNNYLSRSFFEESIQKYNLEVSNYKLIGNLQPIIMDDNRYKNFSNFIIHRYLIKRTK